MAHREIKVALKINPCETKEIIINNRVDFGLTLKGDVIQQVN